MKKFISSLLLTAMLLSSVPTLADSEVFPHAFWAPNDNYTVAMESKNYQDIIKYGNECIEIAKGMDECKEKKEVLVSRYYNVGLAYAELKDYANAAKTFDTMHKYVSQYGNEYYDYVISSKARAIEYAPEITMYTDKGTPVYYGAKNEKETGVLFGICSDSKTRSELPNESMVLIYQEVGYPLRQFDKNTLKEANNKGIAVEFALNCLHEADDIANIESMTSSLQEISNELSKYPNMPVYLRFAAEFDIWTKLTDAESFKKAFRYVSKFFKDRNPNVAMVWSANYVSNWNINIDDFYPGDEYVDWVGVSLYAQKYFLADKNQREENEIVFQSGINSNPVIMLKKIIERYGDRKPIMAAESGCGHTLVEMHEDATDFAMERIKQYYYYLPMVYPQLKLMAYFDRYIQGEKNNFSLTGNATIKNEYLKLTKGARFIQNSYNNNVNLCYRPITDGTKVEATFPLSCYVHGYNDNVKDVAYYIDDKYVGMSSEIPYTVSVSTDFSGNHKLKALATFQSGKTLETVSTINIKNDISVKINNQKIDFDQDPIIYNDRTMVPMRKIFEVLGADVEWDGATKTITATKGSTIVTITIGSNKMYVNNREIKLDVPAMVVSDRTLVPVRAIAEGLDCNVGWDGRTKTVFIKQ